MRFLLVHGYMGQPRDMKLLAEALDTIHGRGSAHIAALHPWWHGGPAPPFDSEAFTTAIRQAWPDSAAPLVVIGHSTGGTLALLALEDQRPTLLVLAGTPPHVDVSHLTRLESHIGQPRACPNLFEVSRMAQAIRAAGKKGLPRSFPVLLLHGQEDELVPAADLRFWDQPPNLRTVILPGVGHDLFRGLALSRSLDAILESCSPASILSPSEISRLRLLEPTVLDYAEANPDSLAALAQSPSVRRALRLHPELPAGLGPLASAPVLANVEVSSRCPHACPTCARALQPVARGDMTLERFSELLNRLPHASRITLVGLGEPTLNRDLPTLVAAARGRSVGLVTSGAALTAHLARELVDAGLGTATFSLDAAEPDLAAELRPGIPFARTEKVLREAARVFRERVPLAVFTAVSLKNARHLFPVACLAQELGARAWMLSDLNFPENQSHSIAGAGKEGDRDAIRTTVAKALAGGLPVLDVRGLEELGKPLRLREYLLRPADRLWTRNRSHAACLSPWQTAPIGADGTLTACDCQPQRIVGNIFERPFLELWNGPEMRRLRLELLTDNLTPSCRVCPRL